jgi:hypothetical protein
MNLVQYRSLPSRVTPCEPKVVMVQYYERPWQGPITIILLQFMLIHIFNAEVQVLRALVTEVTGRHKWQHLDAAYLMSLTYHGH